MDELLSSPLTLSRPVLLPYIITWRYPLSVCVCLAHFVSISHPPDDAERAQLRETLVCRNWFSARNVAEVEFDVIATRLNSTREFLDSSR